MTTSTAEQACAIALTHRFCALRPADVPQTTRQDISALLLDYMGVALAGSCTDTGALARRYARESGGAGEATILGDEARCEPGAAAFANAISSHSVDLDDADALAHFHFSPSIYSPALAVAETVDATGAQLLVALAAGCEMTERVSRATNPALRDRGFDTSSACGVMGGAVAAGLLLELDPVELASAIGLAGAQASGLMEMYGASMQRQFNNGPAARAAVTAAQMARLGFTGQESILEGPRGFLQALSDGADPTSLRADLNQPYDVVIDYKPYPNARPLHAAVDCAIELREDHDVRVDEVTAIRAVRHPEWERFHDIPAPRSRGEAGVSLQYAIAVALTYGTVRREHYLPEVLADPRIQSLCRRIEVASDPTFDAPLCYELTVGTTDGRTVRTRCDHPLGSAANPMTRQQITAKFQDLAEPVVGADRARVLQRAALELEDLGSVRSLFHTADRRPLAVSP